MVSVPESQESCAVPDPYHLHMSVGSRDLFFLSWELSFLPALGQSLGRGLKMLVLPERKVFGRELQAWPSLPTRMLGKKDLYWKRQLWRRKVVGQKGSLKRREKLFHSTHNPRFSPAGECRLFTNQSWSCDRDTQEWGWGSNGEP